MGLTGDSPCPYRLTLRLCAAGNHAALAFSSQTLRLTVDGVHNASSPFVSARFFSLTP